MPTMKILVVFLVLLVSWSSVSCQVAPHAGGQNNNSTNRNNNFTSHFGHEKVKFEVATVDFNNVSGPFTIMLWILIASFAKLGFHMSPKLSSLFPESSLVILLGILIGGILKGLELDVQIFSSRVFFLFMLPPIVLEAGYFLQDRAFFDNIGTILLYAVVGTLFNAFAVGLSLYGLTKSGVGLPLMQCLIFGALIAAVDPVAVLAVFEEVKVNVMLYILVFGESLLNDAVTVVLYHLFEKLALMEEVTYKEILLGFANFLVVSLGGTLMGLVWGFATAFATKFTTHVRVIEPIFVFVMSYLAYLCAEIFHFSGIMSIVTCAIFMKPYVERNISRKSHTTVKYFMKMLSSSSETLIFMFLGISLVTYDHHWNTEFVLWTLFLITVYRTIGVGGLTYLANRFGRLNQLSAVDQFIMSYGGIRGAVSFSLAILLSKDHFPLKDMVVTTTIVIAIFTIFFQGTTIKPLVGVLHVRLHGSEKKDMYAQLNDKLLDHLVAGIEEVMGHRGHTYYWEMVEHFHNRYLRRWLVRESAWERMIHDEDILLAYRKLEYKDALTHLEREGSSSLLFASPSGHHLQALTTSSVANAEGNTDSEALLLRGGGYLRVPDLVVRDSRSGAEPCESVIISETPHNLSNILARSRKTYSHRKFQRNNIIDDFVDSSMTPSHLLPYHVQPLRFKVPPTVPEVKHKTHRHRRHHKKKGRHKKHGAENFPPKKKLSTIFEPEEGEAKAEEREAELASRRPKESAKEDEGISFTAGGVRWKIGRQLSLEETETDKLIPRIIIGPEKQDSSSSSSEDESTGDELDEPNKPEPEETSTSPMESIPLASVVVDIENETPDAKKEGTGRERNV